MEPRSTDTRLIPTPALYGQFRLFPQKAHIFSLKLTRFIYGPRLIRTTDTFLCPHVSHKLSYIVKPALRTLVICTLSFFHCHNYVITVDSVPCSNNDRFLRVNEILLQY